MQNASDLDSQVKILFTKASEVKPYGFALILETDDGSPALFVGKTEIAARNQAKEELKTAKKKKMVIGLVFVKDKKLVMKQGSKAIQTALVSKAFKKLKSKTKKYKGVFAKTPNLLDTAVTDELQDAEEESVETTSSKSSKYMGMLQKLQGRFEDLENAYQDAQSAFTQTTSVMLDASASATEIENDLQGVFKQIEILKPRLHSIEKMILKSKAKEEIKQSLKLLKEDIKSQQLIVDVLVDRISSLSVDGTLNTEGADVGSIAWLVQQAKALQSKAEAPSPNIGGGQSEPVSEKVIKDIKAFVLQLEELLKKETDGEVTSSKEEAKQEAKLKDLIVQYSDAMVKALVGNKSQALGTRAKAISELAFRKAQVEILRFQSVVLSSSVIANDIRFPAIQKAIFGLELTDTLSASLGSLTAAKEISKAIAAYEKSNKTTLEEWKKVDKKSPFGKFKVYSSLSKAFKQISKLKT